VRAEAHAVYREEIRVGTARIIVIASPRTLGRAFAHEDARWRWIADRPIFST
jgi:hypothetical protein